MITTETLSRCPVQREDFGAGDYRVPVAHKLADGEKTALHDVLARVESHPYTDYAGFREEIAFVAENTVPNFLPEICHRFVSQDTARNPVLYLKNCPVDPHVPILDFVDPLTSKYAQKKTFIGEAFLAVVSHLLGTDIIGYRTANNGDKFQDIVPMEALQDTPSQKTAGVLRFHADIPHNAVRADWVYLLSLRNPSVNEVYTCYTRVIDALDYVGPELAALLHEPQYYSAHDTIHVQGGRPAGFTRLRPLILVEGNKLFTTFFEGNTYCDEPDGREALQRFTEGLYRKRYNLFLEEGDFAGFSNNTCLHARHIVSMRDPEINKTRWLLKTWNLDDVKPFCGHMLPNNPFTVNE